MKNILALCALSLLVANTACDDCRDVECTPNQILRVEFLSAADSSSIFGPNGYSLDSLRVAPLPKVGSTYEPLITLTRTGSDYTLDLEVVPDNEGFAFRFKTNDRDTLFLQSHQDDVIKCCSDRAILDGGTFRGQALDYRPGQVKVRLYK